MEAVSNITDDSFGRVVSSAPWALVDVRAPWCGPCRPSGTPPRRSAGRSWRPKASTARGGALAPPAPSGASLRLGVMAPVLEQVARKLRGRIVVTKLNADDNPQVPARFGIGSIPTLLLFRNGQLVEGLVGVVPGAALKSWVEKHMT